MTVPSVGGYQAGEYLPTTVQVLNGEKTSNEPVRVDRVPGKEFRYSGGGYVVVQQLLMDVTGQSFPALMHELVFEPLGMTHSTFEAPLPKSLWPNPTTNLIPVGISTQQWHLPGCGLLRLTFACSRLELRKPTKANRSSFLNR
jgi:CubicO group peptidase (beta-lactamase class C family)